MESSDLFSHPYEAVPAPNAEPPSEEVQHPTFSDGPQSDKPAAAPPSS